MCSDLQLFWKPENPNGTVYTHELSAKASPWVDTAHLGFSSLSMFCSSVTLLFSQPAWRHPFGDLWMSQTTHYVGCMFAFCIDILFANSQPRPVCTSTLPAHIHTAPSPIEAVETILLPYNGKPFQTDFRYVLPNWTHSIHANLYKRAIPPIVLHTLWAFVDSSDIWHILIWQLQ